jgi:pilus assembly protein CpaC
MARWTLCGAAALTVFRLTLVAAGLDVAAAAPRTPEPPAGGVRVVASEFGSNFIPLGIGKSVVVDLPRDVKDVLVADPKIANAVVRTVRRAYLIGVAVGQTNIYFFDAEGRQLAGFDIAVTKDLNGMRGALRQLFPDGNVRVEAIADGVMLTGIVATAAEAQHAYDIAGRLVGDNNKVVNGIVVRSRDQVMLKVTVAEVQRDVIKQLGIDLTGSLGKGAVVDFTTNNPFTAALENISNTTVVGRFSSVAGTLRAMERAGVIRTLAEPTLSAISGESATFLAGGEFPLPHGYSCQPSLLPGTSPLCQINIDFKKFGVSLTFTPVVLGEGRISLKVMTEVSDLSSENALTLQNLGSTIIVPSVRVRRADTTVEIPSGGSLAMAGMIQEQTKQQINGFPALMQIPILGTLFRSRDYVNRQTELMILVTPYVVHAVARNELSRPDDGFADAPDPSTVLLGRFNRLSGASATGGRVDPQRSYRGNYGFILE